MTSSNQTFRLRGEVQTDVVASFINKDRQTSRLCQRYSISLLESIMFLSANLKIPLIMRHPFGAFDS
jgi:hypothetical protein